MTNIHDTCLLHYLLFFFSFSMCTAHEEYSMITFQVYDNNSFFDLDLVFNLSNFLNSYPATHVYSIDLEFTVEAFSCPKNFYCALNSLLPIPCPSGTFTRFNFSTSVDDCVTNQSDLCGVGLHWKSSVARCLPCAPGFFCRNSIQHPCEPGKFTSTFSSHDCILCDNGFYADLNRTACLQCNPGRYCEQGIQKPCLPGFYAPVYRASQCVRCSSGTYANTIATECLPCTPGYFCINGIQSICPVSQFNNISRSFSCLACSNGSYTSASRTQCILCDEIGFFCVNGKKNSCASLGTDFYSNMSIGSSFCFQCPAGTYINNRTNPSGFLPCNIGFFCKEGVQRPCPYSTFSEQQQSQNCSQCRPGTYVMQNSAASLCHLCPVGFFCANYSLEQCRHGTFSNVSNSTFCFQCPNGTFVLEAVPARSCEVCLPGYYCQNYSRFKCMPGYYSNISMATACVLCAPGTFHTEKQNTCYACEKGFYCVNGSMRSCLVGTYTNIAYSTTCLVCPNYSYHILLQDQTKPINCNVCELGNFCVNYNQYPCKTVHGFSNVPGASVCSDCFDGGYLDANFTVCTSCEPGYYCPGKKKSNSTRKKCEKGTFTFNYNSTQCFACTMPGYYYNETVEDCMLCPVGSYCFNNEIKQCSRGSFANLQGMSECSTCPVGFYTSKENDRCLICEKGHYCVSGILIPCPYSYYNPLQGQFQCTFCALGSLAYHLDVGRIDPCNPCPVDYYCPTPQHKYPCPEGSYSTQGSISILNCFCDERYLCLFRKLIELQIVVSLEDQGSVLLSFQNNITEMVNYLQKSSSFVTNLRLAYAEMKQIDVSQVIFKGISLDNTEL